MSPDQARWAFLCHKHLHGCNPLCARALFLRERWLRRIKQRVLGYVDAAPEKD